MIGTIEQGIIDKITAAAGVANPLGYVLPTVKSYGGELEGPFAEIARNFPAVLVMFAGIRRSEELGGGAWKHTAAFAVIVGNQDRRNNTAARRGVESRPGSYQMVTDMLTLLTGTDLDLEIADIRPGRVTALINSKTVSVYSAEIETDFILEYQAPDSDLDTFATLNADWDIPTLGNVSTVLPADDADATDSIKPETE